MSRADAPQPPKRRTTVRPAPVTDPTVLPPPGDATAGYTDSDDTDRTDTDRTDTHPSGYEAV